MKTMGKIGMLIAISLLMLHSFMPHQHHNQISDEQHTLEHAAADSILDYILLAFHVSPGENHLEDFEKTSSTFYFCANVEICEFQVIEHQEAPIQSAWVELDFIISHQFLSKQLSFRGPPQLV